MFFGCYRKNIGEQFVPEYPEEFSFRIHRQAVIVLDNAGVRTSMAEYCFMQLIDAFPMRAGSSA